MRQPYPSGFLEKDDETVDPGMTARWGVTPNISLGVAANSDFSQVEADVAQLNVNERFALFFPEKRHFFLEGSDYFATPIQAVFTRTVADPKWGIKGTGKVGATAGGLFVTTDEVNSFLIPSNQETGFGFIDEEVTGGVVRYRRDILDRSTIGVLLAGREGEGDYRHHVAGIDANLQLSDSSSIVFQYLRSDTQYPRGLALDFAQPLASFDGNGAQLAFNHVSRNAGATGCGGAAHRGPRRAPDGRDDRPLRQHRRARCSCSSTSPTRARRRSSAAASTRTSTA